jgi:Putative beta-barrel porin-2, OmpL-like. bbp2
VNYWLVNGTQQTEPFNGYKDEFFGLTFTPGEKLSWNVNYYLGQEHPDAEYFPNGGAPPNAPTLQGVPFEPIPNAPKGKLHIFDTYITWHATPKLTLAGEADYELERLYTSSVPAHVDGGTLYASYQLTPKLSLAGRAEYMSERGTLFGTISQALKETTLTTKYQVVNGFDIFGEWRRDFSNQPYFFTNILNVLKKEQNTATIGLVWWWGGKQGSW